MGLFKSKLLNDNHRAAVPVLVVTIGVLGCLSAMQLYSGEPIQNSPTVTNVSAPSGVFAAVMNDSEPLQVEGFKYQILRKRNIWERPTRLACGKRPGGYTCSQRYGRRQCHIMCTADDGGGSTRYRPNGVFYELLFSTLDALKLRFFKYVPVAVKRVNKPVHILGWCVVVYYGQRWTRMALRFGLRLLAAVSETGTHGLGYMCGASVRVVWSLLVFVGVQVRTVADIPNDAI